MTKTVTMQKIRETKGTVLFGTTDGDGGRDVTFYLPKTWLAKGESPESITLTIETPNGGKKR
jgi:hypothetical protein